MARVTITIKDNPKDGSADVEMKFFPVVQKGETFTPAQQLAMELARAMNNGVEPE